MVTVKAESHQNNSSDLTLNLSSLNYSLSNILSIYLTVSFTDFHRSGVLPNFSYTTKLKQTWLVSYPQTASMQPPSHHLPDALQQRSITPVVYLLVQHTLQLLTEQLRGHQGLDSFPALHFADILQIRQVSLSLR